MILFDELEEYSHEQLVLCSDKNSGLKAIIAIHDTTLGPAIGGCRMWNYPTLNDSVKDALRISRGMTYKAAVSGLNLGGGQAVILGNPKTDKNELIFRAFGRYVEGLGGRYITAEDVGTDVNDMELVRMETNYVTGISKALGGSGDPSPVTAYGVYVGMKACAEERWGSDSLKDRKIAIQGMGQVGRYLAEHLYAEGADLYIADIDEEKIDAALTTVKARVVEPEKIYEIEADIFSPNALGGVINNDSLNQLNCEIIAGGANNQLEEEKVHGTQILEKDILYAPDYVINAGGLINVANELEGYRQDRAMKQAEGIYSILKNVFKISKDENIPTYLASNRIAEERIKKIGGMKNIFTGMK
jgi:leucine dehydrogenase